MEATADDIARELVRVSIEIHAAMRRETECAARERSASAERAAVLSDRLKCQHRAAQLVAAIGFGPNFPSILAQEMP